MPQVEGVNDTRSCPLTRAQAGRPHTIRRPAARSAELAAASRSDDVQSGVRVLGGGVEAAVRGPARVSVMVSIHCRRSRPRLLRNASHYRDLAGARGPPAAPLMIARSSRRHAPAPRRRRRPETFGIGGRCHPETRNHLHPFDARPAFRNSWICARVALKPRSAPCFGVTLATFNSGGATTSHAVARRRAVSITMAPGDNQRAPPRPLPANGAARPLPQPIDPIPLTPLRPHCCPLRASRTNQTPPAGKG